MDYGAFLALPSKKKVPIPVYNNCPYANQEVLKIVKKLRDIEEKNRQVRIYYANLFNALKLRIKNQQQLDEHRRQGHPQHSPDCPECKRGAAKQRSHQRAFTRQGGELSVDIGGPYHPGVPVTDRMVAKHQWPKYMLVGAFIPFGEKEAKARYEQEVMDRRAANLEGPVQLETTTKPNAQTLYFVELLPAKSDAPMAIIRMVNRIENQHKCKAVCRIHVDRAQELTGERARQVFENR